MALEDIIGVLEQSLADNDSLSVRMHLAELLLQAQRPGDALRHIQVALAAQPDDALALGLAAGACDQLGDPTRAAAYRRLGGQPAALVPLPAEPAATAGDQPAALDALDLELAGLINADRRERVRMSDVAGLTEVKRRLELSFFGPLRNPELREAFGATMRGGLLLYGPPGCGKTFLARAIAGEMGAQFLTIGLHDVLDMWLGNSEKQLHAMFDEARRRAPTVLFFDELDALGMKRALQRGSAMRNVLAQLLEELDGVAHNNEGVFVLGATNQPWDVDPALRRPGRFDRTLLVLPPDEPAREAILDYHLRDRPHAGLKLQKLAKATDGWSGADLRLVCEGAAEFALEESVKASKVIPINDDHIRASFARIQPTTRSWFELARNATAFANEDGTFDELLAYFRR